MLSQLPSPEWKKEERDSIVMEVSEVMKCHSDIADRKMIEEWAWVIRMMYVMPAGILEMNRNEILKVIHCNGS